MYGFKITPRCFLITIGCLRYHSLTIFSLFVIVSFLKDPNEIGLLTSVVGIFSIYSYKLNSYLRKVRIKERLLTIIKATCRRCLSDVLRSPVKSREDY